MDNQVDFVSKFMCTINKPLYFVSIGISMSLLLLITHYFPKNLSLSYLIVIIITSGLMNLSYFVGKRLKEKNNKLNIQKIKLSKKILFFGLTFIECIILTFVLAIIVVKVSLI